ncbi:MAG: hypothetical protein M1820_000222 [Bogoriella megaspora]|nr:MAG: hypothetical protein M1820_000222 [Bogoriella megaspora]
MVELRKRKPKEEAPAPPPKKRSGPKASKAKDEPTVTKEDVAAAVQDAAAASAPNGSATADTAKKGTTAAGAPKVGDSIDLEGFGGEVETHDGNKTTLSELVAESKAGVVIFTYPKASTPGCTDQAKRFRDSYEPLTSTTGLSLYGLSTDSPKSNSNFKAKQNLQYALLCDSAATLIGALGFKKAPKGTTRGVVVIEKDGEGKGKVLAAEAGGPEKTVEIVRKAVAGKAKEGTKEDKEAADTAGEVADTAAEVDGEKA